MQDLTIHERAGSSLQGNLPIYLAIVDIKTVVVMNIAAVNKEKCFGFLHYYYH